MFESLVNKWAVLNGGPGSGIRGHQTDRRIDPRQATNQSTTQDGKPVWSVMLRHPKGGRVQILPSGNTKEEALKDAYRASKYHEGFKVQENTIKPHHSYSFFTPTPASMKSRLNSDQIRGIGPSAGASRNIRTHGGLRVKNAGTPEGVQKAWVTRKSGGGWVNTHPTRNEGYGFRGTVDTRRMSGDHHWNEAMDAIMPHITKMGGTAEDARNFLDSKYGRHFADQVNGGRIGGMSHKEVANQTRFGRDNIKGSMWHGAMKDAIKNRSLYNGRPSFSAQVARFKTNPVIVNAGTSEGVKKAWETRKYESTSQKGLHYWAEPVPKLLAGDSPSFHVVSQAKGFPGTEAHKDWFGYAKDADEIAQKLSRGERIENSGIVPVQDNILNLPAVLTPDGKNAPAIDAAMGVDGRGKTPLNEIVPARSTSGHATGMDGKVLPNSDKLVGPVMSVDTEKLMNASSAPSLIHIAPYGEFPHLSSGLMQIVDQTAANNIVKNFNTQKDSNSKFDGLLVDFDHSSALGKGSVAAGWITNLQAKADGLWASVAWTPKGAKAIQNKEFKYCSPVWNRNECEELGNDRIRPTALSELAICNNPNIAGSEPLARVMV